jgi:hypothetical protein
LHHTAGAAIFVLSRHVIASASKWGIGGAGSISALAQDIRYLGYFRIENFFLGVLSTRMHTFAISLSVCLEENRKGSAQEPVRRVSVGGSSMWRPGTSPLSVAASRESHPVHFSM